MHFRIDLWEESENQRWRFRRRFHEPVVYFIHLLPHMFYMSIEVFFFPTSHSGSCVGGIVSMLDDSSHISHVIICVIRISGIYSKAPTQTTNNRIRTLQNGPRT